MNGPDERRAASRRRIAYILIAIIVLAAVVAAAGYVAFGRDDDEDGAAPVALPEVPSSLTRPEFPTVAVRGRTVPLTIPAPPETPDATWDALAAKAERDGRVSVIVAFRNPLRPEGLLGRAARLVQRRRIALATSAVVNRLGGAATDVMRYDVVPMVALRATPRGIGILRALPQISVFEDVKLALPPMSAAPQAGVELKEWWDVYQTQMNTAWSRGYDGRGYTVAILDTGVARNHAYLRGKVVNEACFSVGRNCPNRRAQQFGAGAAAPCTFRCAHGTHVAHTAAGKFGVARAANIIAVQVFSRGARDACIRAKYTDGMCPLTDTRDYLSGLKHVYNLRNRYRIAAVNLSLGGGHYPQYCDNGWHFRAWADTLASYRIATVVSSGNDGYGTGIGSPACVSTAVAVGATTLANGADTVWAKSNSSPILDLLAPGVFICSAVPNRPNGHECDWNGTSMAAPHVAGAYAVLRQLSPNATVPAMTNALAASGTAVRDPRNGVTRTRIDVWEAVVRLYASR